MKSKLLFSIALFAAAGLVSSVQGAIFDNYNGATTVDTTFDRISTGTPNTGFAYQFTAEESVTSVVNISAALRAASGTTTVDVSIWMDSGADTVSTRMYNESVVLGATDLSFNTLASITFVSGTEYWISFSNPQDATDSEWLHTTEAPVTALSADTSVSGTLNSTGGDWGDYGTFETTAFAISAVPEPSSIALVSGLCLVGFAAVRRARSKK